MRKYEIRSSTQFILFYSATNTESFCTQRIRLCLSSHGLNTSGLSCIMLVFNLDVICMKNIFSSLNEVQDDEENA